MNFDTWQRRMETWARDQRSRVPRLPSLPRGAQWQWQWPVKLKWPPWEDDREQRRRLQEEFERRKKQLHDLCRATKVESVSELQEILCSMVLSECVYKRPISELVRAVNKFKADFGGQIVSLERVQPSLDHVSHRYLLAEAGDTLFASFIGTKQYKDVMADFNIFQGAILNEDALDDLEETEPAEADIVDIRQGNEDSVRKTHEAKPKQARHKLKPAAHRGFMARAKGIPALELYRLAQKKKRKLVLCGHSLGGAVAALATLAILSGVAQSASKQNEKLQVKCITFSQPPVGNAELRDLVVKKGWQHYFKTYCIPEDLVPRILSPAYFHHYNTHAHSSPADGVTTSLSVFGKEEAGSRRKEDNGEENGEKQLVFGVGPVRTSFWRLSRLVPLEGVKQSLAKFSQKQTSGDASSLSVSAVTTSTTDVVKPQPLEIQEGTDRVSLKPISDSDKEAVDLKTAGKAHRKGSRSNGDNEAWPRVPYLPSYVPFGELYLLGTSSVELLSDSEYSKLTSVKSVIAELRERLQSHSMKSYRARFQRIYDLCTGDNNSLFLGVEQLQQFPHLQQWLGMSIAGAVELGRIVDSLSIHTATTIAPLGWSGRPGEKGSEPLKVDITGFGLHLCTLVQAQVNGNWCSTTLESFPSTPPYSSEDQLQPELQKMRVLIGAPLGHPPKHLVAADSLRIMFPSVDSDSINLKKALSEGKFIRPAGLNSFVIYCTSDFTTVSRTVDVRTRRVRLVGLEGAGKTTLLKAILNQSKKGDLIGGEDPLPEPEVEEGIAGGVCYMDSKGVNLQELKIEASRFRDELWTGIRDLSKKIDLIVLVHNLSHKIPQQSNSNGSDKLPALTLLLDEAKAIGVPWILAVTNKFSVSAHQQKASVDTVLQAYQASPSSTGFLNSCPYVIHISENNLFSINRVEMDGKNILFGPFNHVLRSFQRKSSVLPVEGVNSFNQLVHNVLQRHEESAFEEFARDRQLHETARLRAKELDASKEAHENANSLSAAAVGASLGAGLGLVLAVVMGAASALRKP